ncbi:MAG: 2-amino-4-hydroxy-6-hydroxymethyldihydropteridine diphosphokinase [Bacteroides sp.]|nr:2-amino-4-hydroxy-6-hydroxymethyldihydropteridine diphosphokinase [Bacteroides sp.]
MAKIFLGLGTNLGEKEKNLWLAIHYIEKRIGKILSRSAFYVTPPWGFVSDNEFLNGVIEVDASLSPEELLRTTQEIEIGMGRVSRSADGNYTDRSIDIDLLLYDDLILEADSLTLPHPYLHKRLFVLEPLAEIAPDYLHPVLKKSMATLLAELQADIAT